MKNRAVPSSTISCPGDEEVCPGQKSILSKHSLFQLGAFNFEKFTSQLMTATQCAEYDTFNIVESSMELPHDENIYHGTLINYSFSSTSSEENLPKHLQVAKQFLEEYDKQHKVSIDKSEVSRKKIKVSITEGGEGKSVKCLEEIKLEISTCADTNKEEEGEVKCIPETQMSSDGELFTEDMSSSIEVQCMHAK